MLSLNRLLNKEKETVGDSNDSSESKKIKSSGGQERFVPGYETDYEFQDDKTQTEEINPAGIPYFNMHDYTLKRVKRNSIQPAVSEMPTRQKTIST